MGRNLSPDAAGATVRSDALQALDAEIRGLLQRHAENATMDLIARALNQYSRCNLRGYLSSLVTSQDAMRDLARRSYLHGNGFYKIPLTDSETHALRLHVWRPSAIAEENLHSHRWPFASTVVLGSLTSEFWVDALEDDACSFPELMYRSKEEDFAFFGQCRVRLNDVRRHVAGDYYTMNADELHRIVDVGGQLTMTVMMRPHNTRSWARNILLNDIVPHTKPSYLSVEQLSTVFDEVLEAFAAGGAG